MKPEVGKIIIKKGLNIGYLPQETIRKKKQEKKSNKLIYEKCKQLQRLNRLKKKITEIEEQIDILENELSSLS